ncbi:MAG TPA: porin, partial [bacterium]|nr:porin [bacterium]
MKRNRLTAGILAASVAFGVSAGIGKAFADDQAAAPSPVPTAAPPASPIKVSGFLQAWLDAGNSPSTAPGINYNLTGDYLRHLRLRFEATPLPGVQVVCVPELAGGFVLLDGYALLNFDQVFLGQSAPGGFSLTAGQFKTPFGLNRMYTPNQLLGVEYATINNGTFSQTNFWDSGLMSTYKDKDFRLDVAAIKGQGPNLFITTPASSPLALLNSNQDYVGRLEIFLGQNLSVGGSYYYGLQKSSAIKNWFGAFLKWKGDPKTWDAEAEFISRDNANLSVNETFGVNAQVGVWAGDSFQPFLLYEYVENHLTPASSSGRMGGGI